MLFDFAEKKIFKDVNVYTSILLFAKEENKKQTKACVAKKEISKEDLSKYFKQNFQICDFNSDYWIILSDVAKRLKAKIEKMGTPLKDWDIQIYRGILTGLNEAFIISEEKRQELIKEDPKSNEILRPIIRGEDIKMYSISFANLWLINTHNGVKEKGIERVDIDNYPAIKRHLDSYWEKVTSRRDQGNTPYNLRNCAYMESFSKQKIIYQELAQGSSFSLDSKGEYFVLNSGYLITGNHLKYLLAMLNSKLTEYCFRKFYATKLGKRGIRWLPQNIINLPILRPTKETVEEIETLVESKDYKKIDLLVYEMYGLNEEERKLIENSLD